MPDPIILQAELSEHVSDGFEAIGAAGQKAGEQAAQGMKAMGSAVNETALQLKGLKSTLAELQALSPRLGGEAQSQVAAEIAKIKAEMAGLQGVSTQAAASLKPVATAQDAVATSARSATAGAKQLPPVLEAVHASATKARGGLDLFGGTLGRVFGSFLLYRGITAVIEGVTGLGSALLTTAGNMEQSRIAFTQMLGSAERATAFIKELQGFTLKTPFNFQEVRQLAQELLAMGIAAKDVVPTLSGIADAVAAAGGDKEKLTSVAEAYGKINTEGRVMSRQLLSIAQAGIPVYQILAEGLGVTQAKVRDLTAAGEISAATFNKLFLAYSQANYGGLAEKQSHTFQGLISNVQDLGTQIAATFGTPLIAELDTRLETFLRDLQTPEAQATLADWADKFGKISAAAFDAFDRIVAGATQAAATLRPVTDLLGQLIGQLPAPATLATPPSPAGGEAAKLAGEAAREAAAAEAELAGSTKEQTSALQAQMTGLQRAAEDTRAAYDKMIGPLREQITLLDRAYAAQNDSRKVAELQKKIAVDTALGRDYYSDVGKSARDRLVTEKEQLTTLQEQIKHTGQKNSLEDAITAKEKARDAILEGNKAQQRVVQDQMTALRTAQAQLTTALNTTTTAANAFYYGWHQNGRDLYLGWGRMNDVVGQTPGLVQGVVDKLDLLNFFSFDPLLQGLDEVDRKLGGPGLQGRATLVKDAWNDTFAFFSTHLSALNRGLNVIATAGYAAAVGIRDALGATSPAEHAWLIQWQKDKDATADLWGAGDRDYAAWQKAHPTSAQLDQRAQNRGAADLNIIAADRAAAGSDLRDSRPQVGTPPGPTGGVPKIQAAPTRASATSAGAGQVVGRLEVVHKLPNGTEAREWINLYRKDLARAQADYLLGAGA